MRAIQGGTLFTVLPILAALSTSTRVANAAFANNPNSPSRVPWDVFRFVSQSSKFLNLPQPFANSNEIVISPGDVIWEAGGTSKLFTWSPLDDVVMGGASSSSFDDNTGIWKGTVTTANNGGFVGIRTTRFSSTLNMQGCKGISLKLKNGPPKRFKAIVRDSQEFNGVCWTSSFDLSKNNMQTVKLPFQKMVPTIFAKTVPNQTLNIRNVVAFQLAYSKFEYDGDLNPNFSLGDFSLQILELRAY